MSDDLDLAPGQLFAERYRLEQLVGRGGMGTVWRARDEQDAEVALKIITPRGSDGRPSASAVGRFTREARAMARLRSPHVVRVVDFGSDGQLAYICMELLTGMSLRLALKRETKLSKELTLRVLTQVGRAVALAHQRGIVHRDLKPGNIFLCDYPQPGFVSKVLDFGMAKSLASPLSTVDQLQTRRGRPVGTPYYMSPEQARGIGGVDHRSDLWAMGVVAYECLCGTRPFQGASLVEVLAGITATTPTRPSTLADVPTAFDAWLSRALQRDVQQRFQTVHALLHELREALGVERLGSTSFGGPNSSAGMGQQTRLEAPGFGDRTVKRDSAQSGGSFVGRDHELSALDEARASHCRVLSLVGSPGTGRSRLGREYAGRRRDDFPGGIWICSGAEADADTALWLRMAATLDARLADADPVASIGHALGSLGRGLLLIERADNCHAALTAALPEWLTHAPDMLYLIGTSQPLRVPTERVIELAGLPVPPGEMQGSLGVLKRFDGATLFLRRAVAFHRELLSDHRHTPAIAALARATIGLPLALELVARFCARIDPAAIAHGVAAAVREQSDNHRPTPAQALAGTLRWIWPQLSEIERATLTQLSCFAGGFDVQAAEAVVELPDKTSAVVAELLDELATQGFLERQGRDDDPRYQMRAALRPHYYAQLRNSGDPLRTAAVRRHAGYYAQLGEATAVDMLAYGGGAGRRERYLAEAHNLAAALKLSADQVSPEVAAAHARALAAIQRACGLHSRAAATLMAASARHNLDASVRTELELDRARALLGAGRVRAAEQLIGQIASQLTSASDDTVVARLARLRARCALARSEPWAAALAAAQACRLAEQNSRNVELARSRRLHGRAAAQIGNLLLARTVLAQAAQDAASLGASRLQAVCLAQQGDVERRMGHLAAAWQHLEEALQLCYQLSDRRDEARVLAMLARCQNDDTAEATRLLEQAVGRSRELGDFELEQDLLMQLASRYEAARQDDLARHALRRAEQLAGRARDADAVLTELLLRRANLELRQDRQQALADVVRTLRMIAARSPQAMTLPRRLAMDRLLAQLATGRASSF